MDKIWLREQQVVTEAVALRAHNARWHGTPGFVGWYGAPWVCSSEAQRLTGAAHTVAMVFIPKLVCNTSLGND